MKQLLVVLLIGAISCVALTWLSAALPDLRGTQRDFTPGRWPITVPTYWPPAPKFSMEFDGWRGNTHIQHFALAAAQSDGSLRGPFRLEEWRTGWPFQCFVCFRGHELSPGILPIEGVLPLGPWRSGLPGPGGEDARLPLMPLWPGLIADVALNGLVWWLLLFSIAAAKRHRLRRRGLCPHCAYSLAGLAPNSPCPECGQS